MTRELQTTAPSDNAKWLVLLATGIGTFMTALDSSVVNVILPVIRDTLNSDFASTEWVITIYLLTLSGLLLSFGRLGDLRGHKPVYLTGFGIFVVSSALCGLASSMGGTLSDRTGTRWPGMIGMAIIAIGSLLLSSLGATSAQATIISALALVGLGTGTFISPNNSALMGAAPRHRQGIAAGTLATARSFGMVLGAGLSGAIFTTVMAHSGSVIFQATQVSFWIAAAVAGLGIFTSAARG